MGSPESAPSTQVARNSCNLKPGGKPSRQKLLISEGRAQPSTLAFLEDMHHIHLGTPVSQDIRDPAIQTSSYLGKSAPPAIQTRLLLEKKRIPSKRTCEFAPAIHALLSSGGTRALATPTKRMVDRDLLTSCAQGPHAGPAPTTIDISDLRGCISEMTVDMRYTQHRLLQHHFYEFTSLRIASPHQLNSAQLNSS